MSSSNGHERLVRWVWVGASAVGVTIGVANWKDAADDYAAVQAIPDYRHDGPRAIIARANVRRQVFRSLTQVCFLAVGVVAAFIPPPPPPPSRLRIVTVIGLIVGQAGVVANDLLDRRDRYRVMMAPPYDHPRRRKTDKQEELT